MSEFGKLLQHYKNEVKLDNETAWDVIGWFMRFEEIEHEAVEDVFNCIAAKMHEHFRGKHFDEFYGKHQVSNMYHLDSHGDKITKEMFSPVEAKRIYDRHIKSMGRGMTCWDVYVALNAQYHDNIELYKSWFPGESEEALKDKIIKATIVNWFDDVDADENKVWNYFKKV